MDLYECYHSFGGNLQEVLDRLPSKNLLVRFLRKFPEDPSFEGLCGAISADDRETAFRCAHSLKGLCLNLGFDRLLRSSSDLTEALRPGTPYCSHRVQTLFLQTRQDYLQVCSAISALEV